MTGRLDGRVVATTRDDDPEDPLVRGLAADGARVLVWPTFVAEGPADPRPLEAATRTLATYDWVAFTSARSVAALAGLIAPPHGTPKIAAVGEATARALMACGWTADLVARGQGAEALAEAMDVAAELDGARVLFPASSLARSTLEDALATRGARVQRVEAYRVRAVPPDATRVWADLASGVDVVTFASPSAVYSLAEALGGDLAGGLAGTEVAAIGATTARALEELGVREIELAARASMDGLVDACVTLANRHPRRT